MKPEEQRIAIAEACGWITSKNGTEGFAPRDRKINILCDIYDPLPQYHSDLNAMHAAFLSLPAGSHITFGRHLQEVCGEGLVGYMSSYPEDFAGLARIAHATAAQRAEAFLRTLNLWKP
jgi:hypothetical protein